MTSSPVACQLCGRTPGSDTDAPLSRMLDIEGERRRWTCPDCARDNVRALEAKLEPEWW